MSLVQIARSKCSKRIAQLEEGDEITIEMLKAELTFEELHNIWYSKGLEIIMQGYCKHGYVITDGVTYLRSDKLIEP